MREDEIRARLDGATPGPWENRGYEESPGEQGYWIHAGVGAREYAVAVTFTLSPRQEADAELIAHAPDDLAWALDKLKAQDDEIARLREDIKRCTVSIQELQQLREDF